MVRSSSRIQCGRPENVRYFRVVLGRIRGSGLRSVVAITQVGAQLPLRGASSSVLQGVCIHGLLCRAQADGSPRTDLKAMADGLYDILAGVGTPCAGGRKPWQVRA